MPPPSFSTRTAAPTESNANPTSSASTSSTSANNPVIPIPKPIQSLLKELTPRLRILLLTESKDLSPVLITINHLFDEPSLQSAKKEDPVGKDSHSTAAGTSTHGNHNESAVGGGTTGGEGLSNSSSSREQTKSLTSQISNRINAELMKIFQNEMDQSDATKCNFLITILRQLSGGGLLDPSFIIMEWWDLLLRPVLKDPLTSSVAAARARQLVVLAMSNTPKKIYKEEETPVPSWPRSSNLGNENEKERQREKGRAPYPSSSTEPVNPNSAQSEDSHSSEYGLTSVIRKTSTINEGNKVEKLNMFFRFTQRIFDLYLSEVVFHNSSQRNEEDDEDVMDLREEEAKAQQEKEEAKAKNEGKGSGNGNDASLEIHPTEESKIQEEIENLPNENLSAESTESSPKEPVGDDSSPIDLVGTTWKGNLEAILLTFGQENPTEFFHHLADSFPEPSSRVPLLLLLTVFLRLYSNHAYRITSTKLPKLLVLSLHLDTSETLISLVLTAMIILLPHIPNWIAGGGAGGLPTLLAIFARIVDWRKLNRGWEEKVLKSSGNESGDQENDLDGDFMELERLGRRLNIRNDLEWRRLESNFDTAPTAAPDATQFFTMLYGLFPCNMIRFLRAPIDYLRKANFEFDSPFDLGEWEELFDENSIQSKSSTILRKHILHPSLIVMTAETEIFDKLRWLKHDAPDITAECSSLFLGSWNRPVYNDEEENQHQQPGQRGMVALDGSSLLYSSSPRINRSLTRGRVGSSRGRGHSHQRSNSSQFSHRPFSSGMTPYQGVRPTVDADQILSTYATLRSGAPLPPLGVSAMIPSTSVSNSFPPPPMFSGQSNENHHQSSHQNHNQTRMSRSSTWGSLPPIQSAALTNASLQQQFLSNLPINKRSGLAAPIMTASTSLSGTGSAPRNGIVAGEPTSTPPSPIAKAPEQPNVRSSRNRSGSLSSILSLPKSSTSSASSASATTQYASIPNPNLFSTPLISNVPSNRNHFIHPLSSSSSFTSSHASINTPNQTASIPNAQHQPNTFSPQLRPLRNEIYTELSYLQRENLLLRNELNFELYLKEQHLRHIGRLHRDRINDTALEAERQNLYQNNRSLRNQLNNSINLLEKQRNENIRSNNRQINWTNELNSKLKGFREEKKNWLNELRESRAKIESAERIIRDQDIKLQELGSENFEKETELNSLLPKIESLKSYENKINQLSTCLSFWDQDVRKFEQQRKEMEILLGRWNEMELLLQSSEESLKSELKGKNELETRLEKCENELRISRLKIQELQREKEKNRAAIGLLNHDQHGPQKTEAVGSPQAKPGSGNHSEKLERENSELRAQIEVFSSNLQNMAARIDTLEAEKSYHNARMRLIDQDKSQFRLNQFLDRGKDADADADGEKQKKVRESEIEDLDLSLDNQDHGEDTQDHVGND